MPSANKGDIVQCNNCANEIFRFASDCADYKNIPHNLMEKQKLNPIFSSEISTLYTRFQCPICSNSLFLRRIDNDLWRLDATVIREDN